MSDSSSGRRPLRIVGIDASAGGLDALERFFQNLPRDTGMAFVVVQHLSPDFKSVMDELLARHTELPIRLVEDGMLVEPDRVYLIPPRKEMIISSGRLLLSEREQQQELTLPIDVFFRPLAQDCGPRAVAIVLSGGGSDGSRGVRDVHEAGGLVLVQNTESAQFDGMPSTARAAGVADAVLPPQDMPRALIEHAARPAQAIADDAAAEPRGFAAVYQMLEREFGIDFTHYKPSTVTRRIERRLALARTEDIDEYVRRLVRERGELDHLYRDLLIGVTQFFRDAEAFRVLEEQVLPGLLERASNESPLRLWVAGCATGEEAYSLAIAELTELTNDMDNLLASTEVGTIFLDGQLRIRKFTPAIAETFSLVPHDVGRRIETFAHKMDHPELVEDLKRVVASGRPVERELRDLRGRAFFLRILPYRVKGAVDGVVLTMIDVSGLKAAEDALFHERYLLNSLLSSVPDGIYFEDARGRFIRANHAMAARLGLGDPAEAVGKTELDLPDPEQAAAMRIEDDAVLRSGEAQHYRLERRVRKDGAAEWDLVTRLPLRDRAGGVVGVVVVFRNVTEQKRAEEKIQEAVRRRDEFLAMLSHELRNPLGAIVMATSLLKAAGADPVKRKDLLETLDRQTHQMSRLLDDLLEASRVTQNKIELRKEVVDLAAVVREAADVVRAQLEARGVHFATEIAAEEIYVHGDPARLQQIQVNLLSNAAKYTHPGDRVLLRAGRENGHAVISVRDDGAGIPQEMLESVFDLFVQSSRTLDQAAGGLGVGLTLVRTLVEMHGGTVFARSEGEGQGAEFVVRLPLGPAPKVRHVARARPRPPLRDGATVLIVEDNVDSREMLREVLEEAGFRCVAAGTGARALALLDEARPDFVVLDVGLPEVDGFEVARRIRADPKHAHARLIALTGYGQAADRAAGREAGFDEHLVKPVLPEQLIELLHGMRGSRARDAREVEPAGATAAPGEDWDESGAGEA